MVGCRVLSTSSFGPLDSGRHLLSAYFSRASTFIFDSATVSISVTVLGLVAKTSWIKFVLGDVLVWLGKSTSPGSQSRGRVNCGPVAELSSLLVSFGNIQFRIRPDSNLLLSLPVLGIKPSTLATEQRPAAELSLVSLWDSPGTQGWKRTQKCWFYTAVCFLPHFLSPESQDDTSEPCRQCRNIKEKQSQAQ